MFRKNPRPVARPGERARWRAGQRWPVAGSNHIRTLFQRSGITRTFPGRMPGTIRYVGSSPPADNEVGAGVPFRPWAVEKSAAISAGTGSAADGHAARRQENVASSRVRAAESSDGMRTIIREAGEDRRGFALEDVRPVRHPNGWGKCFLHNPCGQQNWADLQRDV